MPAQRCAAVAALFLMLNAGMAHADHACMIEWQAQGQTAPTRACTQTRNDKTISDAEYVASCMSNNVASPAMNTKATVLKACPPAQAACAATNGSSTAYYYDQIPPILAELKNDCAAQNNRWLAHPGN